MKYHNRPHRQLFYSNAFWLILALFFVVGTLISMELLGITDIRHASAQPPTSVQALGMSIPKTTIKAEESKPRLGLTASFTKVGQERKSIIVQVAVSMNVAGKCHLELARHGDSASIRQTSAVIRDADGTTCESFTIPVSELPSGGDWTVSLQIVTDQGNSPKISQAITIIK